MRLRVAAAGATLIVGAVTAYLLSQGSSAGNPGVVVSPLPVVVRAVPAVPRAVEAPVPLPSLESRPGTTPADVTPGRLLAAPGSVEPPPGVSLGLVECEPASPEEADASLGDDQASWRDVGAPLAPDAWTQGAWDWPALAPGTWRLVASDDSTHVPRERAASPLQVRAGRTTHLEVDLVPVGAVSVRLVHAAGDGVAGAAVRVVGPLPPGSEEETDWGDLVGTRVWRNTTDDEGHCTLTGLEDGQLYGIHGWSEAGDTVTDVLLATRPPAEILTLLVTEPRHVQVRVTARGDGRALPDAQVQVVDGHLNRLRGISRAASPNRPLRSVGPTDAEGLVDVDVEPEAWLLVVCDGFDLGGVRVPPSVEDGVEIRVALDEPGDGLVHVVTLGGAPVAGATVEASIEDGRSARKNGGRAFSDARGVVRLSRFEHWDDLDSGTLRLAARHAVEGIGGLALDIGSVLQGQRGLSRTLVLRPPGSLQIDVSPHGWPQPTLKPYPDRFGPADVRERQANEQLFELTLWFLGTPGLRTEFSTHHRERRSIDLNGFAGGTPTARFDGLESGDYCVELWSSARGVSITSPALRITSGETTQHWIAAPDATTHGRLTVALDAATRTGGGELLMLLPAEGFAFHGALPLLLSPKVALRDRRAKPDPFGQATFELVPPGRWIVGTNLLGAKGTPEWRQSPPFLLGPGEDLLLDVVLETAMPPSGVVFFF